MKLYLLSYPDSEEIVSISENIDILLERYRSKMFGAPDLFLQALELKNRYYDIEAVEDPNTMSSDEMENLKKLRNHSKKYS